MFYAHTISPVCIAVLWAAGMTAFTAHWHILPALALLFFALDFSGGYLVCSSVLNFIIHAMYSGLVAYVNSDTLPFLQPLVLALSLLPGLFSCFLGYYIGASDKTLRGILGFKVKVNKE